MGRVPTTPLLALALLFPLAVSAERAPAVADKYAAMKRAHSSVAAMGEAVQRAGSVPEAKRAAVPEAKRAAAKRANSMASRGRSLVSSCSSHGECSSTEYCDTGTFTLCGGILK